MRRDTREVLAAWMIGLASLSAVAFLLTGCVVNPTTVSTETYTEVEMALIDSTARWSGQLGVNVRGEITTESYVMSSGRATAWYSGGVAYYDREMVERYVRLVPTPGCETAANVAAHEVAHALYMAHDISHWCCMVHMGATPTYPPPVAGALCEGRAARCR